MSTFDSLNKHFEIEEVKEESTEIVVSKQGDDIETAKEVMHTLLAKGSDAIDGILHVAKSTDHPRAYEVAGQLIKTMSDVAKDLVDVKKKEHDMEQKGKEQKIGTQNNLFVGSTHDLMKMLNTPKEVTPDE